MQTLAQELQLTGLCPVYGAETFPGVPSGSLKELHVP